MATTYDWPAGVHFTDATLTAQSSVGVSVSPYTFARETQDWGGERWAISLQFLPVVREHAVILETFLLKLRGGVNKVRLGDPWGSQPRGTNSGTPLVNGAASAGATTIATKGWAISTTGQLLPGDYMEISGHLYQVLASADSDVSGLSTIEVWPRIRDDYADNTVITTVYPRGVFALAEPSVSFTRDVLQYYRTQIELVEAL